MPICNELYRVQIGMNHIRLRPLYFRNRFKANEMSFSFNITLLKYFCFIIFLLLIFSLLFHSSNACLLVIILLSGISYSIIIASIFLPVLANSYCGYINFNFLYRFILLSLTLMCMPSLTTYVFTPELSNLLLQAGDIHSNPGPNHTDVKILYSNINSITADDGNRFEHLKDRANTENCNIILLCETGIHSKEKLNDLKIPNFHDPYMLSRGRGIMVYVNEVFSLKIRKDLMNVELECVWIEISGLKANQKSIIGVCYRSPSQNATLRKDYYKKLEENIKNVQNKLSNNDSVILLGDFNSHNVMFWNDDVTDTAGRELYDLICNVNFQNLIHEPTRIKGNTRSCIDLALTDSPGKFQNLSVSTPVGGSDHSTIILSLDAVVPRDPPIKKTIWQYDRCNKENLNQSISNFDWDTVLNSNHSIDKITQNFTDSLLKIYETEIPSKIITIKSNDQPWMNCRIRREIKTRDRLYNKMKHSKTNQDYLAYTNKCKELKNLIKDRKNEYNKSIVDNLDESNSNSKDYYNLIKKFLGNKYPSNIPTILDPFSKINSFTSEEKAKTFLKIFAEKNHKDTILPIPNDFPNRTNATLEQLSTTEEEVFKYLKELDISKACGPDNITNRMLKMSADSLCKPLAILINKIFITSQYPSCWKFGTIVPLHKKEKKCDPKNYRPVTLLSTLSKICEKVIFKRMFEHVTIHDLLYHQQSGFISGHSTHDQLLAIVDHIHSNIENGNLVKAVFLDISAAFDSVPHNLLLFKLKAYGFRGALYNLLKSYLYNRKVRVRVNNSFSSVTNDEYINAGVAQGSLLGPLMFLLYINDIPDDINSNIFLYADDSSLYCTLDKDDYNTAINVLQNDLNKISEWSNKWGLEFNASKSWDVTFKSVSVKTPDLPYLTLSNTNIPKSNRHKHLGVILDENLNFKDHIDELARKYQNKVNSLKALSRKLKSRHLEKMYNTFIIPTLDHGDLLYYSSTKLHLSRLERIHYQAACIVSGAIRGSCTTKVLRNLNWVTLKTRHDFHSCNYIYKALNNEKPTYILNILDKFRNNNNPDLHNLRTTRLFKFPNSTTSRYLNSPLPRIMRHFESIDKDIQSAPSLEIFKRNLRKELYPVFNSTSTLILNLPRINEIFINRFRVGLFLNCHRFSHNFQDTPSPGCSCGTRLQSENHIFFQCTLLQQHRETLLRTLTELDIRDTFDGLSNQNKIKLLLYGCDNYDLETNNAIILATSKFLISSRFVFKMK